MKCRFGMDVLDIDMLKTFMSKYLSTFGEKVQEIHLQPLDRGSKFLKSKQLTESKQVVLGLDFAVRIIEHTYFVLVVLVVVLVVVLIVVLVVVLVVLVVVVVVVTSRWSDGHVYASTPGDLVSRYLYSFV